MQIQEVKQQLPVTYVLDAAGFRPAKYHANDILFEVPWRPDTDPSLACYKTEGSDIVNRWRDMARGDGGDVLDLIQQIDPSLDLTQALSLAEDMLTGDRFATWIPPQPQMERKTLDLDAYVRTREAKALHADPDRFDDWAIQREDNLSVPGTGARIADLFGVQALEDELQIPYWDANGVEVAGKRRAYDSKVMSLPGGSYETLYGAWLDTDPSKPVVLCEGESDVWSGTLTAGQDYVFLGLPSGAGYSKKVTLPASRRVLIALDGDEAGRVNIPRWADALTEKGNTVEVVPLPEGHDLTSYPNVPGLLAQARPFLTRTPGIVTVGDTYRRATKDGDAGAPLSDFTVDPLRVMIAPEGALSYEVNMGQRQLLLTNEDLSSAKSLSNWAAAHGRTWLGSNTDVGILANNLACDSLFVPTEMSAERAGWHEGHVVWEGGSIGPSPIRYVPRGVHAPLDIRLSPEPWDVDELRAILALGDPATIHPIVAWCAAAPIRALLPQFPALLVTGASGSGKTTLTEQIVPRITGSHVFSTLTSTTPFGVEATIASSNGFPVVFDEYRPGARTDGITRLEQLVRDAYNGIPSIKSAGGDRWNTLQSIRTDAPIVLSGEQTVEETSHAERMVLVHLTRPTVRDAQHADALHQLRGYSGSGMAYSYLAWLVHRHALADIRVSPAGPADLSDRVRYNIGVLNLGWALLDLWLTDVGHRDVLPEPDWSAFEADVDEATSTNPIAEAVQFAAQDDKCDLVWEDDEFYYVQPTALIRHTRDLFVLPGNNASTIKQYLIRQYGGHETKSVPPTAYDGARKKVMRVQKERMVS